MVVPVQVELQIHEFEGLSDTNTLLRGLTQGFTTVESCHHDNHFVFCRDNHKLNSRNPAFVIIEQECVLALDWPDAATC